MLLSKNSIIFTHVHEARKANLHAYKRITTRPAIYERGLWTPRTSEGPTGVRFIQVSLFFSFTYHFKFHLCLKGLSLYWLSPSGPLLPKLISVSVAGSD